MGDYFSHWFAMGEKLGSKAPRIFYVNWFRKNQDGKFLWPGFSENSRVLKWMCERVDGKTGADESPIGLLPRHGDLDLSGLDIAPEDFEELMKVDTTEWRAEIPDIEAHFAVFGDRLPEKLKAELGKLTERLG